MLLKEKKNRPLSFKIMMEVVFSTFFFFQYYMISKPCFFSTILPALINLFGCFFFFVSAKSREWGSNTILTSLLYLQVCDAFTLSSSLQLCKQVWNSGEVWLVIQKVNWLAFRLHLLFRVDTHQRKTRYKVIKEISQKKYLNCLSSTQESLTLY